MADVTLSSNFVSCLLHWNRLWAFFGRLRPLREAATHSRHVLGVFPDAHTLSAGANGLELWRLAATLRQSTTTGRFQLLHPKHVEQSLSDSSSCAMAHQLQQLRLRSASSFKDGLRLHKRKAKVLLCRNMLIHLNGYSILGAGMGTLTQRSPVPHWLLNSQ